MATSPTVRNPQSPFVGGVSQSNYSLAETAYYDYLDTVAALSDGDLLTQAANEALVADGSTQAGTAALGRLWALNNELRKRRLPQTRISA